MLERKRPGWVAKAAPAHKVNIRNPETTTTHLWMERKEVLSIRVLFFRAKVVKHAKGHNT